MKIRAGGIFVIFMIAFTMVYLSVFGVSSNIRLIEAAGKNDTYTLLVNEFRGYIYDCNFEPLVNDGAEEYAAAVNPTAKALEALEPVLSETDKEWICGKFAEGKPFVCKTRELSPQSPDIVFLPVKRRYSGEALAEHIIGYIDGSGKGVSGLEKIYDERLSEMSAKATISFSVNALNGALLGVAPQVSGDGYSSRPGLVLTIDKRIQSIVETVGNKNIKKGAIVVMDVYSGAIRAAASFPGFDPNHVADYLQDKNSALLNRCFASYNVGSVFKPTALAAALEKGISVDYSYECSGCEEVNNLIIRCNNINGHGLLNMKEATEVSCNTYFIDLVRNRLGAERLYQMALNLGFGSPVELAPGYRTSRGNFPAPSELSYGAELAGLAFGQGKLTANPIQIAKTIAAIANGGMAVTPSLALGFSDADGKRLVESEGANEAVRVMSRQTAETIQSFMRGVIYDQNGSGRRAMPETGGAGGKTGSAQTGIMDENGKEIVHAWFAGFFPAYKPKYAVVILNEGAGSGALRSAPVFKKIADQINLTAPDQ
ncbi:MAG: penicillin-binding protein 2 [Oscillospiraceae bacterium]|jgi:penicillin-binding protein 2|nr:penicillin-binding protein 2 [Oscillospiraceae bacterium]